jgi:hypothetical protein
MIDICLYSFFPFLLDMCEVMWGELLVQIRLKKVPSISFTRVLVISSIPDTHLQYVDIYKWKHDHVAEHTDLQCLQ